MATTIFFNSQECLFLLAKICFFMCQFLLLLLRMWFAKKVLFKIAKNFFFFRCQERVCSTPAILCSDTDNYLYASSAKSVMLNAGHILTQTANLYASSAKSVMLNECHIRIQTANLMPRVCSMNAIFWHRQLTLCIECQECDAQSLPYSETVS